MCTFVDGEDGVTDKSDTIKYENDKVWVKSDVADGYSDSVKI